MFYLHRTVSVKRLHPFLLFDGAKNCRLKTASDVEFCIQFSHPRFLQGLFSLVFAMQILILKLRIESVCVHARAFVCSDLCLSACLSTLTFNIMLRLSFE